MKISRDISKFVHSLRGVAVLETMLCLPVLLLVSLGGLQIAHIWLCRQVVEYAAYAAARATVPVAETAVTETAEDNGFTEEESAAFYAARRICAVVGFLGGSTSGLQREWLPTNSYSSKILLGSGVLEGTPTKESSGTVRLNNLGVTVSKLSAWSRQVKVEMDVPLLVPFAGQVIGGMVKVWDDNLLLVYKDTRHTGTIVNGVSHAYGDYYAHLRLNATAVAGKPFVVTTQGNLPSCRNIF